MLTKRLNEALGLIFHRTSRHHQIFYLIVAAISSLPRVNCMLILFRLERADYVLLFLYAADLVGYTYSYTCVVVIVGISIHFRSIT